MNTAERRAKLIFTGIIELLPVYTVIWALAAGNGKLAVALGSIILVAIPLGLELCFRARLSWPLFIFGVLYALGPLLGHGYNLYYYLPWWDDLLHALGGVAFAVVGFCLPDLFGLKAKHEYAFRALFSLCFSMAVALGWEFIEYFIDTVFHADMQSDTFITGITSYLLGEAPGAMDSIPEISSVTVNGRALPGYIDIGLLDTMSDTIKETACAAATVIVLWLDGGRHPAFRREEQSGS